MRKPAIYLSCSALLILASTGFVLSPRTASEGVAQKPKVFIAIYERGAAYQRGKNIFQQPAIKEHISHHEALGDKLIAAGPLKALPDDKTVGVIVFEAEGEDAAQKWLREDPAVANGVFSAVVRQWGVSRIRELRRTSE